MRIKVIDGFRAIAVLGVLWAHIWQLSGTPNYFVAGVDIAKLISFFGTGVDLFFVISGFCMYLMYQAKRTPLSFNSYMLYIKKRWLRIAPVFYFAAIIYGLFAADFILSNFNLNYSLKQVLFIRNFFAEPSVYGPHLWSLSTEWQFYLLLPLIIFAIEKLSFRGMMVYLIAACLLFRGVAWTINVDTSNILDYSIFNRLIEFAMGILTAYLFIERVQGRLFRSWWGIVIGVAIAFTGRVLFTAELSGRSDLIGIISRVFSLPLLTAGFGVVILNALNQSNFFTKFLESRFMNLVGKYSYSMYIWHWLIIIHLTAFLNERLVLPAFLEVNLVFILAVAILFPLSKLSYHLFESFYFSKKKQTERVPASVSSTEFQ